MEALREEHIVAAQAVVRGRKLELGQREGVAQVQHAVHVWVGEGAEELGVLSLGGGVRLKGLGCRPLGLHVRASRHMVSAQLGAVASQGGRSTVAGRPA